jgi:hypothetical protein
VVDNRKTTYHVTPSKIESEFIEIDAGSSVKF